MRRITPCRPSAPIRVQCAEGREHDRRTTSTDFFDELHKNFRADFSKSFCAKTNLRKRKTHRLTKSSTLFFHPRSHHRRIFYLTRSRSFENSHSDNLHRAKNVTNKFSTLSQKNACSISRLQKNRAVIIHTLKKNRTEKFPPSLKNTNSRTTKKQPEIREIPERRGYTNCV